MSSRPSEARAGTHESSILTLSRACDTWVSDSRLRRLPGRQQRMRTDLFDFPLPPERIALRPARPRGAARLLVVRPDAPLQDRVVRDLPELLSPGDQLVVNDTRVIAASLHGRRIGRGPETPIEANL